MEEAGEGVRERGPCGTHRRAIALHRSGRVRGRQRRAEGKARVKAAAFFLYPIDQRTDKALFPPGGRYFTSAARFYVGEVSAAGNGWLMHRQSAARCTSERSCGEERRDLGPLGAPHGGLNTGLHSHCSS